MMHLIAINKSPSTNRLRNGTKIGNQNWSKILTSSISNTLLFPLKHLKELQPILKSDINKKCVLFENMK